LGRIYHGPSPSERPPRAHNPLLWRWCLHVVGLPVSASSSNRTPRRLPCARPRLSGSSAGQVLSSPSSDFPGLEYKTRRHVAPARELLHPVDRNGLAAIAWLLRPDPGRDLCWAIKAKAAMGMCHRSQFLAAVPRAGCWPPCP
jgi:hypothetical protein